MSYDARAQITKNICYLSTHPVLDSISSGLPKNCANPLLPHGLYSNDSYPTRVTNKAAPCHPVELDPPLPVDSSPEVCQPAASGPRLTERRPRGGHRVHAGQPLPLQQVVLGQQSVLEEERSVAVGAARRAGATVDQLAAHGQLLLLVRHAGQQLPHRAAPNQRRPGPVHLPAGGQL